MSDDGEIDDSLLEFSEDDDEAAPGISAAEAAAAAQEQNEEDGMEAEKEVVFARIGRIPWEAWAERQDLFRDACSCVKTLTSERAQGSVLVARSRALPGEEVRAWSARLSWGGVHWASAVLCPGPRSSAWVR